MYPSETVSRDSVSPTAYTYFAFISYKREDEKWARWLKRNLQLYRLPAKTHKKYPSLTRRCSPVFLDKTNLMPGELDSGLASEVQSAKYLIVICSRAAKANSKYLNAELKYFLEGDGDDTRVIPFIVDKSDHPVEECYPDYLAELCKTRNIVGVSVNDDGKRSALLRIIAAMHGIKCEELESDDLRRRRRQRFVAALLALALAAGGWVCWDYYVPKTAYYLDYTEVYGVPKGIIRLSKEEIQSLPAHYTIVTARGLVRDLRYERADGTALTQEQAGRIDSFSRAIYGYNGNDLNTVFRLDSEGSPLVELHYVGQNVIDLMQRSKAEDGTLSSAAAPLLSHSTAIFSGEQDTKYISNVSRYLLSYDDNGYTTEIRYATDAFNRVGTDADGVSGIRFERDDLGRVIRQHYLSFVGTQSQSASNTANFAPGRKRTGEAAISFVYDENGDLAEISLFDDQGKPITNPAMGSTMRSAYERHSKVREAYYTADEQLFTGSNHYAGRDAVYDKYGNVIKRSYFGEDGQPVLCGEGYANEEIGYDEKGRIVKHSYFGVQGEPILNNDGYAAYEDSYNEEGYLVKRSYFGIKGEPALNNDGYASRETSYDLSNSTITYYYFGPNGEPVLNYAGIASEEHVYKNGNLVRESFFGTDGAPVLSVDGCASIETDFDKRGNITKMSFFGVDGKPVLSSLGAAFECVFDDSGRIVKVSFFDTNGELMLFDEMFASLKIVYDRYGNAIKQSISGISNEPVLINNCNGFTAVFDRRGNQIKLTYFGINGEPVLSTEGYAGWEAVFDEYHNEIKRSYFGLDGEPILCSDGYAAWEAVFDEHGNETAHYYFDLRGEPVSAANDSTAAE